MQDCEEYHVKILIVLIANGKQKLLLRELNYIVSVANLKLIRALSEQPLYSISYVIVGGF